MPQRQARSSPLATAYDLASRARAIGKAALYLLLAFFGALLVSAVLKPATGQTLQELMRSGPATGLLAHAGLLLAVVIVPTAVSLRVWKEPIAWSGWSTAGGARLGGLGLACGAGLMALIVFILWAAGAWTGSFLPVSAEQAIGMVLLSAALWLTQSANEEGLYRGYSFVQLSRALSFWAAAAILSLWFGWAHAGQEGATPVSLAAAGLWGLVLAYSFLRTGSLWFALGFHAAWNFTQSFVFGLNNSGGRTPLSLMTSHLQGPPLLTGGAAGPEGSLLGLLAIAALAAVVHFGLPRRLREPRPTEMVTPPITDNPGSEATEGDARERSTG